MSKAKKKQPQKKAATIDQKPEEKTASVTQTPPTIDDVVEAVRYLGENRDYVIKSILAVYASTFFPDKKTPLWLMLVGNPSSNKTTLVDLLKNSEDVYRLDTLTSNPFSAGMRAKENPQDLLPLIDGKCFVIKEYATILGRGNEHVKQYISDLVAIYDGEYSKHSPTRGTVVHKSSFTHIGCVTPMALKKRQKYMSSVGARFLFLRLKKLTPEECAEALDHLWSPGEGMSKEEVHLTVHRFCLDLKERAKTTEIVFKPEIRKRINQLAMLMARARGIAVTELVDMKDEDGAYTKGYEVVDLQIEEPFRAVKQLVRFAKALAIVNGSSEVGQDELRIIAHVVLSSMEVRRADILKAYVGRFEYEVKEAAFVLDKVERTVRRNLEELSALGVLEKFKPDAKPATFTLKEQFHDIFNLFKTEHHG